MRITETKLVTKQQEVIKDVLCNKCGNTCSMPFHRESYYGLIEVAVCGGYASKTLADLTTYTFSLCEECLSELFDTFKIEVQTRNYLPDV